MPKEEGKKIR